MLRDQAEPTLHLVEPVGMGRRAMQVVVWTLRQQAVDFGILVGGVVVTDEVDVEIGGAAVSMCRRKDKNS